MLEICWMNTKWLETNCFVFIVTIIIGATGCGSEDCPKEFVIPGEYRPISDTYSVGDTISFTSKFYKDLFERTLVRNYDFSGLEIEIGALLQRMDTVFYMDRVTQKPFATNLDFNSYFNLLPSNSVDIYVDSEGISSPNGKYIFENDTFYCSFSFVLKKAGLFFLQTRTGFGSRFDPDFPGRCSSIAGSDTYYVYFDINNGHHGNIHLFQEAYDPSEFQYYWGTPDRHFYDRGGYCFIVEE